MQSAAHDRLSAILAQHQPPNWGHHQRQHNPQWDDQQQPQQYGHAQEQYGYDEHRYGHEDEPQDYQRDWSPSPPLAYGPPGAPAHTEQRLPPWAHRNDSPDFSTPWHPPPMQAGDFGGRPPPWGQPTGPPQFGAQYSGDYHAPQQQQAPGMQPSGGGAWAHNQWPGQHAAPPMQRQPVFGASFGGQQQYGGAQPWQPHSPYPGAHA